MQYKLGIIGGTGIYDLEGLKVRDRILPDTPYGKASGEFIIGDMNGKEVVFLPRHGRGHRIAPTFINYRANIYGMKQLGVTHLISISAVGSFKDELKPGSIVFVDQYVDRTKERVHDTFFDEGVAVHIAFADPVCPSLHAKLIEIAKGLGIDYAPWGTYLNIEGPAFSTRAESRLYRSWGMDVIGMTNLYEAKLAKEAEIHFAPIAQVTDYDSWKEESVDVAVILGNLGKALSITRAVLIKFIEGFPYPENACACEQALRGTLVTDPAFIPDSLKKKYELLLNKYL